MKTLQPSEGGVLLLGGRSEIGVALASRLCNGRPVVLAQRPSQHDVGAIEDLLRGGAQQVYCLEWDALVESDLTSIYERAEKACGMPVSRHHSMAIDPEPAPTSQSSSPAQGSN